jgi:hypothetical protein
MKTLLKTLLERRLIPDNSAFCGRVRAVTLGGNVRKVRKDVFYSRLSREGFVCRDELGKPFIMEFDDLETIDGMDIVRFARVYNIKENGLTGAAGKKRGRKPKVAINKLNGGLDNGKDQ